MTAIEAKLDAIMNKPGNNEKRMHTANKVGVVDKGERRMSVEERFLNANRSYTFNPNPNLPTHYTPTLRNHESFSYGGGAQQGPKPGQNYHQAYAQQQ